MLSFLQQLIIIIKQKKWLWGVFLGIITSTAITTYLLGKNQLTTNKVNSFIPQFNQEQTRNTEDKESLTVLLLGYGGAGHQGGFLSDVVQVIHFDFIQAKTVMISIPRDLWVSLPNGTENKINAAYNLDRQKNDNQATTTKKMAEVVTGLPIDYYLAVDFVGFQRIIGEELGGIDVKVSEPLDDPWYPIKGEELNTCGKTPEEVAELSAQYSGFELEKQFVCRYEHLYYPAGMVHMEGGDALKFVRSRHGSSGGDFSRSKRQHEVLLAIKEKLFSLEGIDNIPAVFKQFAEHTQTDLNVNLAEKLWPLLKSTRTHQIIKINLSTENVFTSGHSSQGAYVVQPKSSWQNVHDYIYNLIN